MQIETIALIAMALTLCEVLRRLHAIDQRIEKLLQLQGFGQGSTEPSDEVRALAARGMKIEAMRLYREQCGADVRQAMKIVDELAAGAIARHGGASH